MGGGEPLEYWFIDKAGQPAFPQRYTAASSFVMGLAHVRMGRNYSLAKWSYIDRNGRAVFTYADRSGGRGGGVH